MFYFRNIRLSKYYKKTIVVFLISLICFSAFGCTQRSSSSDTPTKTESTESSSVTVSLTEDNNSKETKDSGGTSASNDYTTEKERSAKQSSSAENNSDVTDRSTAANKTAAKASASEKQTTTKAKSKESTQKSSTCAPSEIICTVTVECKSILDNTDRLKDGHMEYVPSDGYIINNCSVTLENGSSAYDAVKSACDIQGVYLNAVGSSYGVYVAGFNNIDEKDCGSQSGWLYSVNGKYPSKSCGRYILSNGDSVVFTYTIS